MEERYEELKQRLRNEKACLMKKLRKLNRDLGRKNDLSLRLSQVILRNNGVMELIEGDDELRMLAMYCDVRDEDRLKNKLGNGGNARVGYDFSLFFQYYEEVKERPSWVYEYGVLSSKSLSEDDVLKAMIGYRADVGYQSILSVVKDESVLLDKKEKFMGRRINDYIFRRLDESSYGELKKIVLNHRRVKRGKEKMEKILDSREINFKERFVKMTGLDSRFYNFTIFTT